MSTTAELRLTLPEGQLILRPLHERAVRVRLEPPGTAPESPVPTLLTCQPPAFSSNETAAAVTLETAHLRVVFDRASRTLAFSTPEGLDLLREIPGTRQLRAASVQGTPCHAIEQSFDSPPDERLHGLGQFQDGHAGLRGVPRRLVQVNTQIAIPFYLSSRGYGLLWLQAGLTDFNPADTPVHLLKDSAEGPEFTFTVTGSTGAFTDTGRVRSYEGEVEIPADGEYAFYLDYGGMTNRHDLRIDGHPVIWQENFWLPPGAGVIAKLTAGSHRIQVSATKGEPSLTWRRVEDITTLRSPHAEALDYVVFAGPQPNDVIAAYRTVTGAAPLLPRWAYGFWQCRERYKTQEELLANAREHRERHLPVDVIVQDWQYWPAEQWAGMQFDSERYPDPAAMTATLRDELHMRLVISVWENVSKDSDLGRAYEAGGHYVPDSPWLDMTRPATRAAHWAAMRERLHKLGIAGWWLDATEPENDALAGKTTYLGPGELHRLTYPLYVSQAVAEGQLAAAPDRRVCILTRSAFPGQQRYNSITWSGDVGGDWDAFRRQIVAGLNYCASGLPYWTTDIGGFFRPPDQHTDPAYHELLARWFQFGAFCPVFRIHGFGTDTEVWRFGPRFETCARAMLELRYQLLPYLYSAAREVAEAGASLMRPLIMDFPDDAQLDEFPFQFLFGPSLMVAPVTEPGATEWPVYLPGHGLWRDFTSGQAFPGGQTIPCAAPLERIPVLVKAGGIVPMGPPMQHTREKSADPLDILVFPGASGAFTLYEDEGEGHAHEHGAFSEIDLRWDDTLRTLHIGERRGSGYPGMLHTRSLRVRLMEPETTADSSRTCKQVTYSGQVEALSF
jgi:alpha-D-xyloside xylohydrolase